MDNIKFKRDIEKKLIPYESDNIHVESDLFLYDSDLVKIFKKRISVERQETILSLDKVDRNEFVIPKYTLTHGVNIIGYGMDFLNDFESLYNLIQNESLSFTDRKNIAISLYELITNLESIGICYHDIHSSNFLYNNGIKVIDMDSVVFKSIYGKDNFNYNMNLAYLRLARLCFIILINMRIILPFELSSIEQNDIIEFFDDEKKDFFKYVFGFNKDNKHFIDGIESFNEEDSVLIRSYLK